MPYPYADDFTAPAAGMQEDPHVLAGGDLVTARLLAGIPLETHDDRLDQFLGVEMPQDMGPAPEQFHASHLDRILEALAPGLTGFAQQPAHGAAQGFARGLARSLGSAGQRTITARAKFEARQTERQKALDEDRRKATDKYRADRGDALKTTLKDQRAAGQKTADYERDNPMVTKEMVAKSPALAPALGNRISRGTLERVTLKAPGEGKAPPKSLQQIEDEARARAKGAAAGGGGRVTDAQRQTLAFWRRANEAVDAVMGQTDRKGRSLEQRIADQSLGARAQGTYAPGFLQTDDQQVYRNAARAFTQAKLRKESGAAISQKEYDSDYEIYFVQPGDKPRVIEQKRKLRQTVLDGLRGAAGRAYDEHYEGQPEGLLSPEALDVLESEGF